MQIIHTSYIKNIADKTGKTYRELESLWDSFEREVEFDRMQSPYKYTNLKRVDGTLAEEVKRRFEAKLLNPESEVTEDMELEQDNEEFQEDIEENLVSDTEEISDNEITEEDEDEFNEEFLQEIGGLEETEETEEPEIEEEAEEG
jgi:hypothetical protein